MTEYIATRWYRAPEIVLGSTIYSKAVDMWAVGCIIAELYIGRPLFPGKSTVDQMSRIMEITGKPDPSQVEEIFGGSSAHVLLEKVNRVINRSIESVLPTANEDAVDLVKKLLKFSPSERLTIEQTLLHPYVAKYREVSEEIVRESAVTIPLDDNEKRSVATYRNELFNLSQSFTSSINTAAAPPKSKKKKPKQDSEEEKSGEVKKKKNPPSGSKKSNSKTSIKKASGSTLTQSQGTGKKTKTRTKENGSSKNSKTKKHTKSDKTGSTTKTKKGKKGTTSTKKSKKS
jgi:mitogen-activated protein kinase 15